MRGFMMFYQTAQSSLIGAAPPSIVILLVTLTAVVIATYSCRRLRRWGLVTVKRRMRRCRRLFKDRRSGGVTPSRVIEQSLDPRRFEDKTKHDEPSDESTGVETLPQPSSSDGSLPDGPIPKVPEVTDTVLPDPLNQARQLVSGVWRLMPYRDLTVPEGPWEAGLALHGGPVRRHNEDYAMVFRIDDITVAVLADGCGGIPFGQHAAYVAVRGATVSLVRQLAWLTEAVDYPGLEAVALRSIHDASKSVRFQAQRLRIDPTRAMRSTLIVVLATKEKVFYAYLGDGGGYIYHSDDGTLESFITPQKAEGSLNVLTASLGPVIEGEPVAGYMPRRPGDLIWVCSDGVADRTDPGLLGRELLQAAVAYGGEMADVARCFLEQFASYRDEAVPIFDDNMSLVLIGDADTPEILARRAGHGDLDQSADPLPGQVVCAS
jgi:serine/threonine protein phosphatase PrpC